MILFKEPKDIQPLGDFIVDEWGDVIVAIALAAFIVFGAVMTYTPTPSAPENCSTQPQTVRNA